MTIGHCQHDLLTISLHHTCLPHREDPPKPLGIKSPSDCFYSSTLLYCITSSTYISTVPPNIRFGTMIMPIATRALALAHTTRWLPQDDRWPWALFTWTAISWRGIYRCNINYWIANNAGFDKSHGIELGQIYTSWVTLPLHCLFLFLATVTKERAIPGTQLSWLWQTLVYGYPLARFQINLANCTCKEFEHIPDWIFRIKPAFTG